MIVAGHRQQFPLGTTAKAAAPEADTALGPRLGFDPAAVHGQQGQAIGDGVAPLHGDPGVPLAGLLVAIVLRAPANRGGIDQQFGAGQGHQPGCFRVPLVPAHQHPQTPQAGLDRLKALITRGEIELLCETRIIRNVHLAVGACDLAIALQHHGGVVGKARCPPLKQADHQHHPQLLGQGAEVVGGGPGDGLGQVVARHIFDLAEVGAGVQLLAHHELGPLPGRLADRGAGGGHHRFPVSGPALLDQGCAQGAHRKTASGICMVAQCKEPCCSSKAEQSTASMEWFGKASFRACWAA